MRKRRTCTSGKRRFKTKQAAVNAVRGSAYLPFAYLCPECRTWHVTRKAVWK